MSCKSFDVKAYFLGEVDRRDKAASDAHIAQCQNCREELDRLNLTQSALLSLGDEEIPKRIAFVSDRVFEPRWWQSIWRSGPAMGFASAALLAGAILAHGFTRPAPVIAPVSMAKFDAAQIGAEVDKRVQVALAKAVVNMEMREEAKHEQMLAAVAKKSQLQGQALVAAQETVRFYQNQIGRLMVASNYDRSAPQ